MPFDEAVEIATQLGIMITSANVGSDAYDYWLDRVEIAHLHFLDGNNIMCAEYIASANEYAGN